MVETGLTHLMEFVPGAHTQVYLLAIDPSSRSYYLL